MKQVYFFLIGSFIIFSCKAQNIQVLDISNETNTNYTLSNIIVDKTFEKELWNRAIYFKAFTITWKHTA